MLRKLTYLFWFSSALKLINNPANLVFSAAILIVCLAVWKCILRSETQLFTYFFCMRWLKRLFTPSTKTHNWRISCSSHYALIHSQLNNATGIKFKDDVGTFSRSARHARLIHFVSYSAMPYFVSEKREHCQSMVWWEETSYNSL